MKKILLIMLILNSILCAQALDYDTLNVPMTPASRLGVGEKPENFIDVVAKKEAQIANPKKTEKSKDIETYDYTDADLSLKALAVDVSLEVEEEQEEMLRNLSALWVSTAQNSETIQYTIYKLSNPDENKPDDNLIKKILRPVASFSSIAGTAFSANPFMASGALIGGNLLGALASDNKEVNYQFTKVNDADMVVLTRKIDDLQKKLLNLYMDYKTKQKIYFMAQENLKKRELVYNSMQNKSKEEIILADVYYRNAQNIEAKAKTDYLASRSILEQTAGTETLRKIEEYNSSNNSVNSNLQ